MKSLILTIVVVALSGAACFAEPPAPTFKKIRLTDKFQCGGPTTAISTRTGNSTSWPAPTGTKAPTSRRARNLSARGYDPEELLEQLPDLHRRFQRRRLARILYVPIPGADAYWYENPGRQGRPWKKHLALKDVGNESPAWVDINGDGRPELVYNMTG